MTGKRLFGPGRVLLVCVLGMGFIGCSDSLKEVCRSSPTDGRIHVAALCGDSAGFGVGYGGAVQYTKDGGKTWIAGTNRSMCQFSLHALDDRTCFAAGNGSDVIMTGNGGETWTRLSDIPAGCAKGVSFITNDEGWVWTKSALYSTRNNGQTWQTVTLPADIQMIESAFLQSTGNGYLCGLDGYIYRTRDGGRTWERTVQFRDTQDKTFKAVLAGGVQGTAIRLSGERGLVAVIGLKEGKSAIRILRTTDGGETWSEPKYYNLDLPCLTLTISPDLHLAVFNNDSTVSMFALK